MLKIGDWVIFRSWQGFFHCAKTANMRLYLRCSVYNQIEGELTCIEVQRVSKCKWQVMCVYTDENTVNLEDDKIFLKSSCYDTKALLNAVPVKWYNALLGEQVEYRIAEERNL